MKTKRLLATLGLSTFSLMFMGLSFFPHYVSASQAYLCGGFSRLNRAGCHGYFTGTDFYGTYGIQGQNIIDCTKGPSTCVNGEAINNAIPSNIDTAAEFDNWVKGYLFNTSGTGYNYNKAGAAFIVDAMLGRWGTDYGSTAAGISYAQANYNTWKQRVDYYAAAGWITWNWATTLPAGTINSLHACWPSVSNCTVSNISTYDSKDFAFFRNPDPEGSHVLQFHNPNGTTFEIRRECGNLLGSISPLSTPSLTGTCSGMTIDPGKPDPHTPYTVTAAVSYSSSANASLANTLNNMYINVNGPSVAYSNSNVGTTQSGATLRGTVSLGATNNTGTYTVSYGMAGGIGAVSCSGSFTVADQPYTTIGGGDTSSGAGMSTGGVDCAAPADVKGGLVGWNKGASGGYAGAGTQYAALALNYLQDFASAQGTSGLAPTGLSFANTSAAGINVANGLFGGKFGGLSCAPDYFANATGIQTGNITIGGQAVANGTHTTVYVKGNVYITGNITYSGSYASVADIPSYSIIVQGNIYIAPGVSQLDGLYVAEPTVSGGVASNGVIYTCASAPFTAAALNSNLYNTCKVSALTVNGSFVARQVWLLRTAGTVSQTASESFNFNPEVWLSLPPATASGSSSVSSKYDAITSLPPVL